MLMKKLFTLILLMTTVMGYAQNSYVFADKDGTVFENGDTIVRTEVEDSGFDKQINSGLYVKNVSAANGYQVAVSANITRLDNGTVQLCFPENCNYYNSVGNNEAKDKASLAQGALKSIQSEWLPTAYGECIVTYTAQSYQGVFPKSSYKVTVIYRYADPAAIKGLNANQTVLPAQRFDLQGRPLRTSARGLNIVRGSDGKIYKFINK